LRRSTTSADVPRPTSRRSRRPASWPKNVVSHGLRCSRQGNPHRWVWCRAQTIYPAARPTPRLDIPDPTVRDLTRATRRVWLTAHLGNHSRAPDSLACPHILSPTRCRHVDRMVGRDQAAAVTAHPITGHRPGGDRRPKPPTHPGGPRHQPLAHRRTVRRTTKPSPVPAWVRTGSSITPGRKRRCVSC
ncbi:MAG: hypothetical protein QOG46_2501, partial [Pseudonocardiales bacterium]|nr:hypothetical protein [Pseudonocardiales bacterium]